jgi:hypothetical protein
MRKANPVGLVDDHAGTRRLVQDPRDAASPWECCCDELPRWVGKRGRCQESRTCVVLQHGKSGAKEIREPVRHREHVRSGRAIEGSQGPGELEQEEGIPFGQTMESAKRGRCERSPEMGCEERVHVVARERSDRQTFESGQHGFEVDLRRLGVANGRDHAYGIALEAP